MVHHLRNTLLLRRLDRLHSDLYGLTFLFAVVLNVAESALLRTTNLWWVLLVASAIAVAFRAADALAEKRARRLRG
jgi:hypothetical protein